MHNKTLSYYLLSISFMLTALFSGCMKLEEVEQLKTVYADTEADYLTLEGVDIAAADSVKGNNWLDTAYTSLVKGYSGLQRFERYKETFSLDTSLPSYWSLYFFQSTDALNGMAASTAATQANAALTAAFPNNEIQVKKKTSYKKVKSFERDDIGTRGLKNITIVNTEALPAYEQTVNDWEINTHIPWVMGYEGIGKVVRYERISGTDMPKFIEIFYYYDQASADGLGTNEVFKSAEADRLATWKNGELDVPWIVNGILCTNHN